MTAIGKTAVIKAAALLPTLGLACAFLWPTLTGSFLPWTDLRSLGYVVQIESVAMFLGMFMVWPLIMVTDTRAGAIARVVGSTTRMTK